MISVKNCVDCYINHDRSVQKKFSNFLPGVSPRIFFRKKFFHQKHTNDVFLESVFNGDYEFDITLIE
jgi:hypothetical protein